MEHGSGGWNLRPLPFLPRPLRCRKLTYKFSSSLSQLLKLQPRIEGKIGERKTIIHIDMEGKAIGFFSSLQGQLKKKGIIGQPLPLPSDPAPNHLSTAWSGHGMSSMSAALALNPQNTDWTSRTRWGFCEQQCCWTVHRPTWADLTSHESQPDLSF